MRGNNVISTPARWSHPSGLSYPPNWISCHDKTKADATEVMAGREGGGGDWESASFHHITHIYRIYKSNSLYHFTRRCGPIPSSLFSPFFNVFLSHCVAMDNILQQSLRVFFISLGLDLIFYWHILWRHTSCSVASCHPGYKRNRLYICKRRLTSSAQKFQMNDELFEYKKFSKYINDVHTIYISHNGHGQWRNS